MRNIRAGIGKIDVRDITERVDEPTTEQNDLAVCAVLRWAIRTDAGPTAARDMCQLLGLDLLAALRRARAS